MTPRATSDDGGLALADWKQIDAACDRFEAACRAGEFGHEVWRDRTLTIDSAIHREGTHFVPDSGLSGLVKGVRSGHDQRE